MRNEFDEVEFRHFLEQLVDGGYLAGVAGGAAEGITKQVISHGEASLSPKQQDVFNRCVLEVFVSPCGHCGSDIEWSQMLEAYENSGYCYSCEYSWEKMQDE